MHSLEKICFAIVLALVSCVLATGNDNMKDQGSLGDGSGPLWFGPRLGKRSLSQASEENRQAFFKLLEAADTLNYYRDQLPYFDGQASEPANKVMRKVLFTPKLGSHLSPYEEKMIENGDLISQLGRRLSNDMPVTPTDQDIYHSDAEQVDSRTKYFSPRLGRIMGFSPRLGRELAYETFPEELRTVRSINKTRAT